ncbi:PocR ligand-binding domain-containing protein [Geminisphaera colitermitum]|uniref:PocR ligand-binding domain-containing protein n=1 Tax=Geminisphaera colitermitum TaxID=1148786 RepID=UPI00019650E8|nr:PocR ligand-binding domain-containing protein [Geminisphaera colitermitum]
MSHPTSVSLLERFCAHWERVTGLRVCIYDFGYFSMESDRLGMPYERRTHCSGYCALVKTDPGAEARCIKTETWRAEQAGRATRAFVHRCHAGVSDLVVPIRVGTRVLGAVFIGQAGPASAETGEACARRTAAAWGLPEGRLREEMAKLPALPTTRRRGGGGGTRVIRGLAEFEDSARLIADYIRQTLGMAVTESLADAQVARDAQGRIVMEKVPNYFLDRLSVGPGVVKESLAYLRNNYWRDIALPKVAAQVRVSESHFSRTFRRATGMTFRRCLVEARLSAGAWLAKKTDLKVKEIADLLNYRDTSSLLRALRIHAGVTPRGLRNRQPMPWYMNKISLMPG